MDIKTHTQAQNRTGATPEPDALPQVLTLAGALRSYRLQLLVGLGFLSLTYHHIATAMVRDWYFDDNASHGFLVPLVSAYLVWTRRKKLAVAPVSSCPAGLWILVFAMLLLLGGWLASELFIQRFSLVLALCGCTLFWLGRDVFSLLSLPILFLTFMIPIPNIVYDAVALPLKLLVSQMSVGILHALGIVVLREGNVIMFPNITLEVVDACSGLRSLTSLLALGVAYSLIFIRSTGQRLILIAATLPIAIFTNVLRVVGTGLLARHIGAQAASGFFHEFTGIATFVFALLLFAGVHHLLRRFAR